MAAVYSINHSNIHKWWRFEHARKTNRKRVEIKQKRLKIMLTVEMLSDRICQVVSERPAQNRKSEKDLKKGVDRKLKTW